MATKTSKKLNIGERFHLLNLLPQEGVITTFKLIRKFRETLAPDDKENQAYKFQNEFRCPNREYDEKGKAFQCEVTEVAESAPKCPIHLQLMAPTGRLTWDTGMATNEKEVWDGPTIEKVIIEVLKKLNDDGHINEDNQGLYEKFLGAEEEE